MAAPPTLTDLGRDLRELSNFRKALALCTPYLADAACLAFLVRGQWLLGTLFAVVLSFVTYGSVSHDLVHRCYRLPTKLNRFLLVTMELLTLRSGTAYRISHLSHHRYFPTENPDLDTEARVAGKGFWAGVLDGPVQQFRIFAWAWRLHRDKYCVPLLIEGCVIILAWVGAAGFAAAGQWGPLVYIVLVTMGAWTIPLITVTIPHDPLAKASQHQTRVFRGLGFDLLAFGHLYHLEHHLYPSVPHQRWRDLASRLDDYLADENVEPVSVGSLLRGSD